MSVAKLARPAKKQLGQFLTPRHIAERLVADLELTPQTRVLEPSFGDGSFVVPLLDRFCAFYRENGSSNLGKVLQKNVYGVEIDESLYARCLSRIQDRFGTLPPSHNLHCADFFAFDFRGDVGVDPERGVMDDSIRFDYIIGNPPFGGTIDPRLQDALDRKYGSWNGYKVKKETYAFFIVRALEYLTIGGKLRFICSDTFLTIPTMTGLRRLLMEQGQVSVTRLPEFSEETRHPMVILDFTKGPSGSEVVVDGEHIPRRNVEVTANCSWTISPEYVRFFGGPTLSEFVVCSSGMTIGRNDLFVRDIDSEGCVVEPYEFTFRQEKVTLEGELRRARLNKLSAKKQAELREREKQGETFKTVAATRRQQPLRIQLPHTDYRFYNKAASGLVYVPPTHAVYWRNDGEAVITFKKTGNWYLRGVGGRPFFGREGLTWQLISSRLNMRYLPPGYILDSGAPCAFLREGVPEDELFLVLGWTLTERCSSLLKSVLNHTKNIQSKDVERLPYPFWVAGETKHAIIRLIRSLVEEGIRGRRFDRNDPEFSWLEEAFSFADSR